jgi:hypothetical protein
MLGLMFGFGGIKRLGGFPLNIWTHVGGSGDCGVDGIGAGADGKVVGLQVGL